MVAKGGVQCASLIPAPPGSCRANPLNLAIDPKTHAEFWIGFIRINHIHPNPFNELSPALHMIQDIVDNSRLLRLAMIEAKPAVPLFLPAADDE